MKRGFDLQEVDVDMAQAVVDVAAELRAAYTWRDRVRDLFSSVLECTAILRHRRRGM